MSIKSTIKNDLWRVNYILPFVKKHQFDEKGRFDMLRHVLKAYRDIKPVSVKRNRSVAADTKKLLESVRITIDPDSRFVYFLDESKTIAVPGNILSNFTLDYDRIIHGSFAKLAEEAEGQDQYGREACLIEEAVQCMKQLRKNKEYEYERKVVEKEAMVRYAERVRHAALN